MKQFLYKIVLWGLLVFIGLNLIAYLSLYFLGNSFLYKPQYLENGVKENQFDYLVLGSSTGLTTLNTKCIDSLSGKKGLNMSMDDTSMSTHYLMLQHYFALGKKTDCVVLTVMSWDAQNNAPKLNNNDYRFITHARKEYVHNYYKSMEEGLFKPLTASAFFPLAGVSYYNAEVFFPSLMTVFQPKHRNRFDNRGNYTYPVTNSLPKEKEFSRAAMQITNPCFEKIKSFCRAHDTQLIVYIAPLYKQEIVLNMSSIGQINHSNLLESPALFYDGIHVNENGRVLASEAFVKDMKKFWKHEEK